MSASGIKKMYILAIVAIIFVLILHFIGYLPIVAGSGVIQEEWDDHKDHISYHDTTECDSCERYREEISLYNQMGAEMWQETVTNCTLIAIGGTIAYGVGSMLEKKDEDCPDL